MDRGSVSLIAEEAGRGNIHGNIAKVDRDVNGKVSYERRSTLGVVSEGMDGLGFNYPGKREHQYTRYLVSNVLSKQPLEAGLNAVRLLETEDEDSREKRVNLAFHDTDRRSVSNY